MEPKPSATVVLLRDAEPGLELLLLQRAPRGDLFLAPVFLRAGFNLPGGPWRTLNQSGGSNRYS